MYDYLTEHYQPNEPIFVSDIDLPVSAGNLRQMFKTLCDNGKVIRYDTGIYYIPKVSRLKGGVPLGTDTVMKYKYIKRNDKVEGYYSGYTFANQLGITTQVPYVIEIVSNNASAIVREVNMKGRKIILRKARTAINASNYRILQFLDLLKDIDIYAEGDKEQVQKQLMKYIYEEKITRQDLDKYIRQYPDKVFRNMYEMGLFNVFAS